MPPNIAQNFILIDNSKHNLGVKAVCALNLQVYFRELSNKFSLLAKCTVKMAGYWPSSFFASLWVKTDSRSMNEANIQPS